MSKLPFLNFANHFLCCRFAYDTFPIYLLLYPNVAQFFQAFSLNCLTIVVVILPAAEHCNQNSSDDLFDEQALNAAFFVEIASLICWFHQVVFFCTTRLTPTSLQPEIAAADLNKSHLVSTSPVKSESSLNREATLVKSNFFLNREAKVCLTFLSASKSFILYLFFYSVSFLCYRIVQASQNADN